LKDSRPSQGIVPTAPSVPKEIDAEQAMTVTVLPANLDGFDPRFQRAAQQSGTLSMTTDRC
jgi:hypothetical protein